MGGQGEAGLSPPPPGADGSEDAPAPAAPERAAADRSEVERAYFGPFNAFGYRALRAFAGVTIVPYLRLSAEGLERLPDGPCVLAPNHASYLDPVVLQAALDRRVVYLMTSDWYDRTLLRPFFRFMGAVPIRENARSNRAALDSAHGALRSGLPVVIFPEGRVTTDGALGRFHAGVAQIAVRAGVPIVPVGIEGTFAALPKGRLLPRRARVTVRVGTALDVPPVERVDKAARRHAFRELTDRVRGAVEALLPASPV